MAPPHGLKAFAARQPLPGARQQPHRGAVVDPGRVLEMQRRNEKKGDETSENHMRKH